MTNLIDCLDWLHSANSLYRDFSNDWETIHVQAAGRTPNQVAKDQGKDWKVGYVDYDSGIVQLHKKKKK